MAVVGAPRHWQPGQIIAGKYRIDRLIGEGGQAAVLEATHLGLARTVAIKARRSGGAGATKQVRRLLREARAAFHLRGEHVARILDVELVDGEPFIIMEHLNGSDLRKLIASGPPLSVERAVGLILQACDAVSEAHEHGIIHRDLKPANLFLLVRRDGAPLLKVLDFGLSRMVIPAGGRDLSELTQRTQLLGTPSYVAPEQIRDPRGVDARADIWSLGIILQELLTGKPVFRGATRLETVSMVLKNDPAPLSLHRSDVPVDLQRVVLRCLDKRREQRFESVRELAGALAPHAPSWASNSIGRLRALPRRQAHERTEEVGTRRERGVRTSPPIACARDPLESKPVRRPPGTGLRLLERRRVALAAALGVVVVGATVAARFGAMPGLSILNGVNSGERRFETNQRPARWRVGALSGVGGDPPASVSRPPVVESLGRPSVAASVQPLVDRATVAPRVARWTPRARRALSAHAHAPSRTPLHRSQSRGQKVVAARALPAAAVVGSSIAVAAAELEVESRPDPDSDDPLDGRK